MAKKPLHSERRVRSFTLALVAAGCCGLVVIALFAPIARAQLILSALPGMVAIAAVWFRPRHK